MTNELPTGWASVRLNDVCHHITDGDHQAPPRSQLGVPFITIGAINDGILDLARATRYVPEDYLDSLGPHRRARQGDILLSVTGSIGIAAPVDTEAPFIFQRHIALLRPKEGVICRKFLLHALRLSATQEHFRQIATGTAQMTIPLGELRNTSIVLPPLSEQRRIVATLDSLSQRLKGARDNIKRILKLTGRYRQRLLAQAFDYAATCGPTISLGAVITAIEAGKNMRCEERRPNIGERGIVKISAVTWGRFDAKEIKTAPNDALLDVRSIISEGDFLLSRANTLELVGAPVIASGVPKDTYLSDKVLRIRFADYMDRWALWFLRSPQGRSKIEDRSSGNQLSMRNIGQGAIREIPIPMPDKSIRDTLIQRIEAANVAIDRIERDAHRTLALCARLEVSVLSRAFRGELGGMGKTILPDASMAAQ